MKESTLLTYDFAEKLVYGGAILGGGGGGTIEEGFQFLKETFKIGTPTLLSIDQLDEDEIVVTVSMVGAPSSKKVLSSQYIIDSLKFFMKNYPNKVSGIITNEMGPFASVNGLLQSAATSLPVIDAPANGRAHPLSAMGAMGLSKLNYVSYQSGVSDVLRVWVESDINNASRLMREAAVLSGGIISITRNPVSIDYLRKNGAVGAIEFTYTLGKTWTEEVNPYKKVEKVISLLNGDIVGEFQVEEIELSMEGGFDIGKVRFEGYELTFWNEFMTLEKEGKRLSTFPDLIVVFEKETGIPLCSYQLKKDKKVLVGYTHYKNIILGGGMRDEELFEFTEKVIGKELLKYLDLF